MPTQLVISFLRFTLATPDRHQTVPRQSRKNLKSDSAIVPLRSPLIFSRKRLHAATSKTEGSENPYCL